MYHSFVHKLFELVQCQRSIVLAAVMRFKSKILQIVFGVQSFINHNPLREACFATFRKRKFGTLFAKGIITKP